jgi:uncharacterized delta-60 repeat protein
MKTFQTAPLAAALLFAFSTGAHAYDPASYGALDKTFGSLGKQTTSFSPWGDVAHDVALQSNGKIVLAGHASNTDGTDDDFALLRYNADGNLDTTFGVGGKTTTAFFAGPDDRIEQAEGVVVQPDGKIIAAGWTMNPQGQIVFALARYNVDGRLDSSFDTDGLVTTKLRALAEDNADFIRDVALQADGKIVVTGMSFDSVKGKMDFATARYLSNGQLDTSFGTNGIVITPIGASNDGASGIVIQPDGKIVAAGQSCNSLDCDTINGNYDFAFVRYNANGSLDSSFNDDGKATFATAILIYSDGASRVTLQQDGSIVAAGGRTKGDNNYRQRGDFALVRLLPNGQLDTSFGQMGWVKTPIGLDASGAADIAYRPNGQLVVAGAAQYNTVNTSYAIAMYNANGSLDTSFGQAGSGIVTTPFGANPSGANGVALQPNGNIVVVGSADSAAYHDDFAAARYLAPNVIPNAFGFTPLGSQEVSTMVTSAPITLSGLEAPTLVMFSGAGDYSINGGEYTRANGMVGPGDQITVRQTTSASNNTTQTSNLVIGGVNGNFSTTTRAQAGSSGGGAMGLEGLALFGVPLLAWARRRMGIKAK